MKFFVRLENYLQKIPVPAFLLIIAVIQFCITALLSGGLSALFSGPPSSDFPLLWYPNNGEALLRGVSNPDVSYSMPAPGVLLALAANYLPAGADFWFFASGHVIRTLLTFYLARLLSGNLGGLLAVVFSLFWNMKETEQFIYGAFILFALIFLVLRQRSFDVKNSILAGAAVGITFLVRSPLFLLPLLVAGFDLLARKGEKIVWKKTLVFLFSSKER